MTRVRSFLLATLALLVAIAGFTGPAVGAPEGQMTYAVHVSLAPTWFDPAETSGMITPFLVLYALHDAMVKPLPGQSAAPSLAESWTAAPDGLSYEFVVRKGATFHNGEPVTADDVKFSFERYRGTAAAQLKSHVAGIDVVDTQRVRFRLKQPWPDFMAFYGTPATGAGWVVPKKYLEKVGDEGFKKAPIGAGPYKFVSFNPGVELVLEAHAAYWRKTPSVKRLVLRVVPDESTRLAMLKNGEADIAYSIRGALAEELRRSPGLTLKATYLQGTYWVLFADQWDPKSPWADRRVRLAASHAMNRKGLIDAETLGLAKMSGSIIPQSFDFYWPAPPPPAYDPTQAKKLLAEAGFPQGFDAGDYTCDTSYSNIAETIINDFRTIGIRTRLRPLERAGFFKEYAEKKLKNVIQGSSGAYGTAATRIESFVAAGGAYVYGSYPDIEGLVREQGSILDRKKREQTLHRIQQLLHDKIVYAPIWELALLNGQGPRVAEGGLGLISNHAYSAPYEDVRLKKQ
jgi:peptide/nickel transport system substrate-binding protein